MWRDLNPGVYGGVLALMAVAFLTAPSAMAATITVTTTSDSPVVGQCSLREALEAANTNMAVGSCAAGTGAGDTVVVPAGNYVFTSATQLEVRDDTNVIGAGASVTVINANNLARVFNVRDSQSTFEGLTITGGNESGDGGGINADRSQIIVRDSVVTGNRTTGDGGGIDADGGGNSLTLIRSVVSNNTADSDGGGIRLDNNNTTLTVTDSTITGNTSGDEGGGIHIDDTAVVTISGSTISNNRSNRSESVPCSRGGGGINQDGGGSSDSVLNISNSTISGNSAPTSCGGGIFVRRGMTLSNVTIFGNSAPAGAGGNVYRRDSNAPLNVSNTIIAGAPSGSDCVTNGDAPVMTSQGGNIDSDGTCGFSQVSDQAGTNPLLGPLADNGGRTLTHRPQSNSPAIDSGLNVSCEPVDQRGIDRPQDGREDGNLICDIGAVEVTAEELRPASIPVATPWVLALLGGLLAAMGSSRLRRRKVA